MSNLANFLHGIAEGCIEQAESIVEREGDESTETLALRDYFSQLIAVSENTDANGVVDWSALEDRVGIDIEGDDAWQVMLGDLKQGSPHLAEWEAIGHATGLKRVHPTKPVNIVRVHIYNKG